MSKSVTVPDTIALDAGPLLVGIVLNWWLFGIICVQYCLYLLKSSTNDSKVLKTVVHIVFILDAFQTFLMMDDAFDWFVYNYPGDLHQLNRFHYSAISITMVDAVIAFIVQMVYVWRINRLSGWKLVPGICIFGSLLAFGSGMLLAILDMTQLTPSAGFLQAFRVSATLWVLSSAVTDVIIALVTGHLLLRMTKDRPSKATGRKILNILKLTIETNAITSIVAIVIIFLYAMAPRTKLYIACGYVLGKLYSNCFMILLNQRQHYRSGNVQLEVYSTSGGSNTIQVGSGRVQQERGVSSTSPAVAQKTFVEESRDRNTSPRIE